MKTINQVNILGRLGKDAEVKTFPSGGSITKLRVATENSYKDKNSGEWVKETDWHQVVVKGNKAQSAGGLRKGQTVEVNGRLKTRSFETSTGEKRYITEILTYEAKYIDTDHQPAQRSHGEVNYNRPDVSSSSDDLPF